MLKSNLYPTLVGLVVTAVKCHSCYRRKSQGFISDILWVKRNPLYKAMILIKLFCDFLIEVKINKNVIRVLYRFWIIYHTFYLSFLILKLTLTEIISFLYQMNVGTSGFWSRLFSPSIFLLYESTKVALNSTKISIDVQSIHISKTCSWLGLSRICKSCVKSNTRTFLLSPTKRKRTKNPPTDLSGFLSVVG